MLPENLERSHYSKSDPLKVEINLRRSSTTFHNIASKAIYYVMMMMMMMTCDHNTSRKQSVSSGQSHLVPRSKSTHQSLRRSQELIVNSFFFEQQNCIKKELKTQVVPNYKIQKIVHGQTTYHHQTRKTPSPKNKSTPTH